MSAETGAYTCSDEACAQQSRRLVTILSSCSSASGREGVSRAYHSCDYDPVIWTQVARYPPPHPNTQKGRDKGAGNESPADGEDGPALVDVPIVWPRICSRFHLGAAGNTAIKGSVWREWAAS